MRIFWKIYGLLSMGLFCLIFEIEKFQQCNIGQVKNTSIGWKFKLTKN